MIMAKHVLVVEDEKHLAIGIKYNLEADGFRVTTVEDGPAALKVFEDNGDDVDLVILDIMLPGMSGYTVCETLRDKGCDVPVMILSARTLAEDRTRGFDVGADQYLTKPFELQELLSRVNNLLARYERRQTNHLNGESPVTTFEFADAHVNFETFEVQVDGESVRMTQLEFKLLEYFIKNEGRVIPRQELLENVWNMPGTITTRAPDQFIRRLRKIFETDPAKPQHFLTVRDAGYRFVSTPNVD